MQTSSTRGSRKRRTEGRSVCAQAADRKQPWKPMLRCHGSRARACSCSVAPSRHTRLLVPPASTTTTSTAPSSSAAGARRAGRRGQAACHGFGNRPLAGRQQPLSCRPGSAVPLGCCHHAHLPRHWGRAQRWARQPGCPPRATSAHTGGQERGRLRVQHAVCNAIARHMIAPAHPSPSMPLLAHLHRPRLNVPLPHSIVCRGWPHAAGAPHVPRGGVGKAGGKGSEGE